MNSKNVKVGDRIKITRDSDDERRFYSSGETAVVVSVWTDTIRVKFETKRKGDHQWYVDNEHFEIFPKQEPFNLSPFEKACLLKSRVAEDGLETYLKISDNIPFLSKEEFCMLVSLQNEYEKTGFSYRLIEYAENIGVNLFE